MANNQIDIEQTYSLTEQQVAEQIRIGDIIDGKRVTQKAWTRDTAGLLRVHVVSAGEFTETTMELNTSHSFAMRPGLVSSGDLVLGKRVVTEYIGDETGWKVKERHIDPVDATELES